MNYYQFFKRGFFKIFIGPIKYADKDSYSASDYWGDRFRKYSLSLKGSGNERLSKQENKQMYEYQKKIIEKLLIKANISYPNTKVLDVGCGSGYYTQFCQELRVKSYTGIDVTEVLFDKLHRKFPNYRFFKKDVSLNKLIEKFDLILVINVIQHIVNEKKLNFSLNNIKKSLNPGGSIIFGPLSAKSKKRFFYLHDWTINDVKKYFAGYQILVEGDFLLIT